ncbi:1756_t:CDS:2, partial [Scutellospora calospora]
MSEKKFFDVQKEEIEKILEDDKEKIRRICEFVELEETRIYKEIIKFDEIDDEDLSYFFDFENNINIRPFTIDKNDKKSMIFY